MANNAPLHTGLLERVRSDLQLSLKDFCSRLSLSLEDYAAFLRADNLRNFPPRSLGHLRNIMLEMERANLDSFKSHSGARATGYFHSSKILRHMRKVAGIEGGNPERVGPITVELHPSNICNHRCPGCTFNIPRRSQDREAGNNLWKAQLDVDLLDDLIEDMADLEVSGVILSGGGEPLLHPDITTIMRKIHAAGIEVGLVTNGSMLNREGGEEIIAAILESCTWCRISVDAGSQEGYEQMHGRSSAVDFSKLLEGIRRLGAAKLAAKSEVTLGVSYLLTPRNYLELVTAVILFREIEGLDYFQVKPMEIPPLERGMKLDHIYWDRRIFDTLVMLGAYEREGFAVYTPGYKFVDILLSETDGLPFSKCWCHPFCPTITADGTVIVCCHMLDYVFKGSSIGVYGKLSKERRFKDLWMDKARFAVGDEIVVRMCPSNCKLAEANKTLEQMYNDSPHSSFLS